MGKRKKRVTDVIEAYGVNYEESITDSVGILSSMLVRFEAI